MQTPVTDISPANVESLYQKAAANAARFFQKTLWHPVLVRRWQEYRNRNQAMLQAESSRKNINIVLIVFYLAAGLVQGMFLNQMLEMSFFLDEQEQSGWHLLVLVLAAIAPLGCSLLAGHCFGNIHIRRNKLIAGRFDVAWDWLLACLFVSILYLGFVMVLAWFFKDDGMEGLVLVPILSLVELALGIPAAAGINILIISLVERRYANQIIANLRAVMQYSEACAVNYRHYKLCWRIYNQYDENALLEMQNSPQIQRAIQYYEGRGGNGDALQLPVTNSWDMDQS